MGDIRWAQKHPLLRGIVTYSVTWPLGSFIQQTIKSEQYDFKRMAKFSLYGALYVAPTLYGWMRIACRIWPRNTLKYAIIKASVEQVTYSPFAIVSYLSIMTFLDGGDVNDAFSEVSSKFLHTWKVGVVVWPTVQTLNYMIIPEKNRVPFISLCSLCWTVFLAFVKYKNETTN